MSDTVWDVLVVGGGVGAVSATCAAARSGARTLVIERTGRLGGAYTTNLVQPLMGWTRTRHEVVDDILARLAASSSKLHDLALAEAVLDAGGELLLHTWCVSAVVEEGRVVGVRVLNKEGLHDIRARLVIDASGDGDIAASAGVPFEKGRAQDGLTQPMTIMYEVEGQAENAFNCGSEEEALVLPIGDSTWHEVVMAGRARGELPDEVGIIRIYNSSTPGRRIINATQINKVDGLSAADLTRAEIAGRRQARQVTDFLRQNGPGYENCRIAEMPAAVGVRETRRFRGVKTMTLAMLLKGERQPDAIVREASFPVDIHNPDGVGQAEGLAQKVQAYDIPYGCLVPEGVEGLLLSGRNISGTHEAHASYRVQKITMAIGAAAGMAAAECVRQGIQPRELDVTAIQAALGIV